MLNKRRPEIDTLVKSTIDKIAGQVTDEVEYMRQHFVHIYNKVSDWGAIDSDYSNVTLEKAQEICKDKIVQIKYVINLRKQQASKEVSK